MGIKLKWDSMVDQNLDAVEVYRSSTAIDSKNPGTPLVSLAASATAYEDNTVTNKSVYYYRICGKKGTERAWGANQVTGYFSETGPGRAVPFRGDWLSGYMDTISTADLITPADLMAKVPALASFSRGSFTQWYKMCHKGKVLFFPNSYVVSASWNALYAAGVVFGTDDFGQIPTGTPPNPVKQRTIVNINGLEYILRLARHSSIPFSQYLTAQADTIGSEWRSTMSRMCRMTLEPQDGALPRLYDNSVSNIAVGPHLSAATTIASVTTNAPGALITTSTLAVNLPTVMVLELVMP